VNRTDRLYALVDELRAVSPRARSARWLAGRFEVGERTIRRDIDALQQTGVPIYAEPGRLGGYALDRTHSLPPINITAREAIATAVALRALAGTPFLDAARSTLRKLVAVMPSRDVAAAGEAAQRIHLVADGPAVRAEPAPEVLAVAGEALLRRVVLAIDYVDRDGSPSRRLVEPLGLLGASDQWYLIGWCRLRGGVREFRLDRMRQAAATAEIAPARPSELALTGLPDLPLTRLDLLGNLESVGKCGPEGVLVPRQDKR
jgi:predicted DNA-binding transcriptional regulator YafY